MAAPETDSETSLGQELEALADSWGISLEAENKSARTIAIYTESVQFLAADLPAALEAARRRATAEGAGEAEDDPGELTLPEDVQGLAKRHVEAYLAYLLTELERKPSTVSIRYRALRRFFGWLVEEGEVGESPMRNIKGPQVPDEPVRIVEDDELERLLKCCDGTGFYDRRDTALIMFLLDTGVRRAGCAGLDVPHLDLRRRTAEVLGKGRRRYTVTFGAKTARALDRYLRVRARHRLAAETDALWLGQRGGLSGDGIRQMLERRGRQAGIENLHAHRFRHTFAHLWLAEGGNEGDLMILTDWRTRQMLDRYGRSAAARRARQAHRKFSPGDRTGRRRGR